MREKILMANEIFKEEKEKGKRNILKNKLQNE